MKDIYVRALYAAVEAGKEILEIYAQDFGVDYKSDDSPLTLADRRAHQVIMHHLEDTGIPILSEEGKDIPFAERATWQRWWLVDPLDGTKEFIKKNGDFTVNIALLEAGTPVFGVIYIPVNDTLYFGGMDMGAFKLENAAANIGVFENKKDEIVQNDIYLQAQKIPLPKPQTDRNYTVVASRSHLNTDTQIYLEQLQQSKGTLSLVSRGSSLKICLVAEGIADEYPRLAPTMEWDIAAGHAIALGAGKKIIDFEYKEKLVYNKESLKNPSFICL